MTRNNPVQDKMAKETSNCFAYMRDGFIQSLSAEEIEIIFQPYDASAMIPAAKQCLFENSSGGHLYHTPFSWDFSTESDRGIPYRLHSFKYQNCMLLEYFRTGDEQFRDLFISWVFDWVRAYPRIDRTDPWAWHDDATARRVFYFCVCLVLFEKLLNTEQIRSLRNSLRMQARLLSREDFYKFGHNHGMYQDVALGMYALCCDDEAEYYYKLSAARSRVYFTRRFSGEGIHKEHSPLYQTDIARSIFWFCLAFRGKNDDYVSELENLLRKMQVYVTWITMPDGLYPSIGDSPKRCKRFSQFWNSPEYRYAVSQGHEGYPPTELMRVFPQSGYGIVRKDWVMNGKSTWMMLLAATHGEAHKHNDDLSFLVYHDGAELITEAGNRNYNYSDPLTEYCYSSYGHNVLFVDGQGWKIKPNHLPLIEKAAYKTGIIAWKSEPEFSSVSGRQIRFPGVIQVRTLQYDRKNSIVVLEDRITTERPAEFRLIYHIAPDMEIRQDGQHSWRLRRENKETARVVIVGNTSDLITRFLEESEPPWGTEVFWGKPEARHGSLLMADWKVKAGGMQSIIQIRIQLFD